MYQRSCIQLDTDQSLRLKELLLEFVGVFAVDDDDLGRTALVKHTINVGDAKPVKQAPRRQAIAKRQLEEAEIARMLKQGVISPSSGPWASPTVLPTKKVKRGFAWIIGNLTR